MPMASFTWECLDVASHLAINPPNSKTRNVVLEKALEQKWYFQERRQITFNICHQTIISFGFQVITTKFQNIINECKTDISFF